MNLLGYLLEKLKRPDEENELSQAAAVAIDVDDEVAHGAALIEAVYEDDEARRVQSLMLGVKHDAVLEPEKQATAAGFVLGPKKHSP